MTPAKISAKILPALSTLPSEGETANTFHAIITHAYCFRAACCGTERQEGVSTDALLCKRDVAQPHPLASHSVAQSRRQAVFAQLQHSTILPISVFLCSASTTENPE